MQTITSFHASAIQPDQLSEVTAAYVALEGARIFRQLLVKRCAMLAVVVAGVSVTWLSTFAFTVSVGLCVAAPALAWTFERGCERRLTRLLDAMPARAMHLVEPARPPAQKVIKSS